MPRGPTEVLLDDARPRDLEALRALLREYREEVGADPCFETFEAELAGLPGEYAPGAGALLVARRGDELVGCVALRRIGPPDTRICEMKRLYVRQDARGSGLGRALVEAVIAAARARGYRRMRLDTLPSMASAIELYRRLGFRAIGRYAEDCARDALYLERELAAD